MTAVTREGANAGTLAYQHAEQLLGKPPTASVDVYSFAVVTLEVFTRAPAWEGFTYKEVSDSIMNGKFPKVPQGKVPVDAEAVIQKCFQPAVNRPSFTELLPSLKDMVGDIEIW